MVIRGATVVTGTHSEVADIGIQGGKIVALGSLADFHAPVEIAGAGLTAIPGVIDTQVHFREPGLEHKEDLESGTRAALMGGVTSILEMPNTHPPTVSPQMLQDKLDRAASRAWCHYGFFVGASAENADDLAQFENLPGTPGIKIFMGSSTGPLLVGDDETLERVLRSGTKRVAVHAEDEPRNTARKSLISEHPHPREHPFLRDAESARLATERIIRLSQKTGRQVHILHISTGDEPPLIQQAKRAGIPITAEVTPQHLYFNGDEAYERLGSWVQMNPPIRGAEHQAALWRALADGIFDVFGSDHAPHTLVEKQLLYPGSPSGMPGVQTLLSVLLTFCHQGRQDLKTLVRMACETPASLYGIVGKGQLAVGYDADVVLVDPHRSYQFERSMVESKCGWSPYEGDTFTGSVEHVILGGQWAVRSGERLEVASGRQLVFNHP